MIALRSSAACWIAAAAAVALVLVLASAPTTAPAPALQLHERPDLIRTSSGPDRDRLRIEDTLRHGVLEDSIVDLPRHDPGY